MLQFVLLLLLPVLLLATLFYRDKIIKFFDAFLLTNDLHVQSTRIYKKFQFQQTDFPLKVILANQPILLREPLERVINQFNSLFKNTVFFTLIDGIDPKPQLYNGEDNDELFEMSNANVCVALVTNSHYHGKVNAGTFEGGTDSDVLAHANMPNTSKKAIVCLDASNIDFFTDQVFITKVLMHEFGHILGLLDIPAGQFTRETGRGATIMDGANVCKKQLPNGIDNPFDKQSLKMLYPWVTKPDKLVNAWYFGQFQKL